LDSQIIFSEWNVPRLLPQEEPQLIVEKRASVPRFTGLSSSFVACALKRLGA
jgi:hypothetical protein